jgi:hypothetical protein
MPKIEILAYSPLDLDKFIKFCIKGVEQSPGVAAVDEDGREILGVFSWLHGWSAREAHFFHTPKNHPMKFFMALVRKRKDDDEVRPWFRRVAATPPKITVEPDIPGIDKVLRIDGELGELEAFLPISELLAAVESDPALDAEFVAQQGRVLETLKRLEEDPDGIKRFLAALRSDKGSRPREVFEELKFSLRG